MDEIFIDSPYFVTLIKALNQIIWLPSGFEYI